MQRKRTPVVPHVSSALVAAVLAIGAVTCLVSQAAADDPKPPVAPATPEKGADTGADTSSEKRSEKSPDKTASATPTAIQWFGTWTAGAREAKRTGRPILLIAAAPQCHGVSGLW